MSKGWPKNVKEERQRLLLEDLAKLDDLFEDDFEAVLVDDPDSVQTMITELEQKSLKELEIAWGRLGSWNRGDFCLQYGVSKDKYAEELHRIIGQREIKNREATNGLDELDGIELEGLISSIEAVSNDELCKAYGLNKDDYLELLKKEKALREEKARQADEDYDW